MTGSEALAAWKFLKRRREVDEQADGILKAWADANGGIIDGNKVWLASFSEGRSSIDTKSLAKDYPNIAEKYTRNGAPFKTYRWTRKGGLE
jgi:predicted phage-related endonuclease